MAHIDTPVIEVMDSTSFAPGADAITAFLPSPKKAVICNMLIYKEIYVFSLA